MSTLRFAELLEINFLICGLLLTTTTSSTTCSSSSSCRPPCKKLKRVSGMRATSPGWDLKQMRVGEMTALWLLSSLSAGCWLSPGEVFCDRIVWGCLEQEGEEE